MVLLLFSGYFFIWVFVCMCVWYMLLFENVCASFLSYSFLSIYLSFIPFLRPFFRYCNTAFQCDALNEKTKWRLLSSFFSDAFYIVQHPSHDTNINICRFSSFFTCLFYARRFVGTWDAFDCRSRTKPSFFRVHSWFFWVPHVEV